MSLKVVKRAGRGGNFFSLSFSFFSHSAWGFRVFSRSSLFDMILLISAELLGRDHDALDLGGSLVDLGDLGVAEVPLDDVFLGVPIAAVNLDGLGGNPHRGLGGGELGHGG